MTVKFYGKAEEAANVILGAFQNPEKLPRALAPIFIKRKDDLPCRKWSWNNQFLTAMMGHSDARGFRQWQSVGRYVKKGEKCFHILSPVMKKIDDKKTGEKKMIPVGFKATPVFGLSQTDGEPLPVDEENREFIDSLPLLNVAKEWNLEIDTFSGETARVLGWFRFDATGEGKAISVGVKNLSTWAHEMIHASDSRLGNLTERGQHWRSEIVAELGSAVLLSVLGFEHDADLGGCWDYVERYASGVEIEPIVACGRVLKRMCDAVALILDTAEKLAVVEVTAVIA